MKIYLDFPTCSNYINLILKILSLNILQKITNKPKIPLSF